MSIDVPIKQISLLKTGKITFIYHKCHTYNTCPLHLMMYGKCNIVTCKPVTNSNIDTHLTCKLVTSLNFWRVTSSKQLKYKHIPVHVWIYILNVMLIFNKTWNLMDSWHVILLLYADATLSSFCLNNLLSILINNEDPSQIKT